MATAYVEIPLGGKKAAGRTAKIDVEDYELVSRHMCDKKRFYLGYFEDKEEAARAYDAKAVELYGEYAYLNFPDKITQMVP